MLSRDFRSAAFELFALFVIVSALGSLGFTQDYLQAIGVPTFATSHPVEMGDVNIGNGNLHLEIPIASFPQRGSLVYNARLIYDSRFWQVVNQGWVPTTVPQGNSTGNAVGAWHFTDPANFSETAGSSDRVGYQLTSTICTQGYNVSYYRYFYWRDDHGTPHYFPITLKFPSRRCSDNTIINNGTAYAADATGYFMNITGGAGGGFTVAVYGPDGTVVYGPTPAGLTSSTPRTDPNGNYFSADSSGNLIDTLGRKPVLTTVNGSQTTYAILDSQGGRSNYVVTSESIAVNTNFGVAGIAEYSGTVTVISSLKLPDGSEYIFNYDVGGYGELMSMTLPTGGTVQYGYTNYKDSFGTTNRWVSSHTSGGGTTDFSPTVISSCTVNGGNCVQQVTVTQPSLDNAVYTFQVNNGAWLSEAQYYTGAVSPANLIATTSNTWNTSVACTFVPACPGGMNIQKITATTTLPVPGGNITDKSVIKYDSPQTGNVTALQNWKFYNGTNPTFPATPDRETDYGYLSTSTYTTLHIINRLTSVATQTNGTQASQTLISYDSTPLTSITGITQHNDASFGSSYTTRGNATLIQYLVSGTSYLTATTYYDTTGQVVQLKDAAGNSTFSSYVDNFFNDNGQNPPSSTTAPAATNAYITKVTGPLIGPSTFGYYFGTGKQAYSQDANGANKYQHYMDVEDRLTTTFGPLTVGVRSWVLNNFTSATQQDYYSTINDTQAATTCSSCRHDQKHFDGYARAVRSVLVSDAKSPVYVDTVWDTSGRVYSVSNPYRSTSDPTYGLQTNTYDGLNRKLTVTYPDGSVAKTYYGAAVSTVGGNASQLCPTGTYSYGYPVLTVDPAGKLHQVWTDGFGRTIETDEEGASNTLSISTCSSYSSLNDLLQVVQGTHSRSYAYDELSRMTSSSTEAGVTQFFYTTSAGALCSGTPSLVCRRTDARGVTITYAYDALNRLSSKSYSDGTAAVTYLYDQTSYNGLSISNGLGRRTGMSDGAGTTAWSYDPTGHTIAERRTIAGISKTISYGLDIGGFLTSITYPSGHNIAYSYNNAAQVVSVVDGTSSINYALQGTYAPQGNVSTMLYGQATGFGGITETYGYNNRLQINAISASSSAGGVLDYSYGYGTAKNNNGNSSLETDLLYSGRTQTYTYDNLNRLLSAHSQDTTQGATDCWGQSYGYDQWGNLLTVTVTQCSALQLNVSVNTNNQITTSGFSYDQSGNLLNDGTYAYSWNAENELKSGGGVSYTYDGNSLRVEKSSGTLYWRNVEGDTLTEATSTGSIANEYIYLGGRLIARRDSSGNVYYYFADRVGSTRAITTSTGAVCFSADYFPFGTEIDYTNTCPQNYKFQGHEHDSETGNDYLRSRYYSARLGRFLTPDPVYGNTSDPQSLNRYLYTRNNPVNRIDSDGRYPQDQHEFITFILAALIGLPDAADIGFASGYPDVCCATTQFPFGSFMNFSYHFGIPCTQPGGNPCANMSNVKQLGFDLHLIEDISPGAPHDLLGSYTKLARVGDEIGHVFLNLIFLSPDTSPNRGSGFYYAWVSMGGAPSQYPSDAIEGMRDFMNQSNLAFVSASVTVNGNTLNLGGEIPADAVLIKTITENGVTIDIWKLPDNYSQQQYLQYQDELQFQEFLATDAATVQQLNMIYVNPFSNMMNLISWWNYEFGCAGGIICSTPQ